METVNMLEAKTTLSKLVEAIESGREDEIIIARNGRPAAKLVRVEHFAVERRIGIAKGHFQVPDDIDRLNPEIAALFGQ